VTLPTFAAKHRAAEPLLLTAGRAAVDRYPGCWAHSSKPAGLLQNGCIIKTAQSTTPVGRLDWK